MILYVVRHAWAGHYGDPEWPDDFQRPLTAAGRRRFAEVVRVLATRGVAPELVATSPLVRCHQTAEVLAEGLSPRPELVELDALAPGSDLGQLLAWTRRQAAACREVAWVGHAPDVGRITAELIGNRGGWIRFAKGAVAAVQFEGPPRRREGELTWLVTAKLLGC